MGGVDEHDSPGNNMAAKKYQVRAVRMAIEESRK
jgi:hypothetical protein